MPAPFVLDPGYNFNQMIGQSLGGGIGQGINSSVNNYFQRKQLKQQSQGLAPLFEQLGIPAEGINQLLQSGLPTENLMKVAEIAQKSQQDRNKNQPTQMAPEKQQGLKDVFKRMDDLRKGGTIGSRLSLANPITSPQSAQDRAEFDTLNANFEAIFKDMVNTGVLSAPRFEYLLSILPKASDRERVIKGKMKAISQVPELSFLKDQFEEDFSKDRKKVEAKKPPLESFYG